MQNNTYFWIIFIVVLANLIFCNTSKCISLFMFSVFSINNLNMHPSGM